MQVSPANLRVIRVSFDPLMPRDPFADDPMDPASFLENDYDPLPPLSDEERAQVQHDLHLVAKFKKELQPHGVIGVFFTCEDCDQPHYYDWDIMAANMRATLAGEVSPVHEPTINPDPHAYVTWDYCLGYLDGIHSRRRHF